ncbi:DUF5722 domain-containing protein [Butyrivibrio sp. MC2013]|uniref:DUF5722 domain-containing protein n=1 Tax=Butyrivibrio sp. MC2013 TaxID=1280686 RepID=UPI0004113319|nr:DUF5722 domain-containing protein [Butyrivibrio sp. MC2013]
MNNKAATNDIGQMRYFIKFLSIFLTAILLIVSWPGDIAFPAIGDGFAATRAHAASGRHYSLSARIVSGAVTVTATSPSEFRTDDGMLHLYAADVYESSDSLHGRSIAFASAGRTAVFHLSLKADTADSRLYKKFMVGAVIDGVMTMVSNAAYIVNPEAIADHTVARVPAGKKGILPAAPISAAALTSVGADQATYNILLSQLLSSSGGTIPYEYNGRTYNFSAGLITAYDSMMQVFAQCGVRVSLIILNDWQADQTTIHPSSRVPGAGHYYAFNASDAEGAQRLAAVGSFLASHYSGAHGQVDNFIIGNEVNARQDWNYMSAVDVDTYARAIADSFRIFYTAIKSENANAGVYLPIDQQWSKTSEPGKYYGGRAFLDSFNSYIAREGNIGWDLAHHPYNVFLYNPTSWSNPSKYVSHSGDTWFITMQNIEVLTDYMCSASYLKRDGSVRSILCSEVGYTSSQGEGLQAASVTFGYEQAMANSHIDGFILSREKDDPGEIAQGLANGLRRQDGSEKPAFAYYANLDTDNAQAYKDAAAAVIGCGDISSILVYR